MFSKKIMIIAIILASLLTVSAVSATDSMENQVLTVNETINSIEPVANDDVQNKEILTMDDDYVDDDSDDYWDDDSDDYEDDDEDYWDDDEDYEDDYSDYDEDDESIDAKLEIIDYPDECDENQITFKLTDKIDNSPLANIDLGILSYLPEKDDAAQNDDKLSAELNSRPLTFMPKISQLTKITTDSMGIAVYTIPDIFLEDFMISAGFYIEDGLSSHTEATINGVKKDIYMDFFDTNMTAPIYKAILNLSKEGTYYNDVIFKVSLIANNNRTISNETVQVTFSNGKKVSILTNSNGTATYKLPFDVGTYSATAKIVSKKFISDSATLSNIVISKVPVTLSPTKLSTTYASGKYFQVKVVNVNTKKAVENIKLSLKVYTGNKYKTVTVTTDSNGVAKYSTSSLSIGKHKITASIKDTKNCVGSSKSSSVKITKSGVSISAPSQYVVFNKGPSFKVTIKNKASKKGVAGIAVTAKVYTGKKYKTVTAKTNSKGIATFSTKGFSKGKHAIKISTKSNANYLSGSAKSSMNVLASKITTYITVTQGIRFVIANTGLVLTSAIATLRDINGKELFKPIKVYSSSQSITTETSGYSIPISLTYSQTFTFKYEGDSLYKPATTTHYMTVL